MAAIKPLRGALVAACALAGVTSGPVRATEVETAAMYYGEQDRVLVFEPVFQIRHPLSETRTLTAKLVLDGLTGASPNGAVPSTRPQTFTRPSGSSSYTAPANQIPLDDAFQDFRGELDVGLEKRYGLLTRATYGLRGSVEQDYLTFGGNLVFSREFERRNRMLTVGLSGGIDQVSPSGGAPTAMTEMAAPGEDKGGDDFRLAEDGEGEGEGGGGELKGTADLLLGFTQIVDRKTVAQINYSASYAGGYLNDPYKFVSVVEGPDGAAPGEPLTQLYEGRPDSRLKQSLFTRVKRDLGRDIIDLSYRYLWDDWGVRSHTAELRYHLRFSESSAVVPHLRWYRQTEADFYRHSLVDGEPLPVNASADPRLAAFDAWTYGLKLRHTLSDGREISLRLEYYHQNGEDHPADAVGQLRQQDLFPDLRSFIVQIGYRFDFLYNGR